MINFLKNLFKTPKADSSAVTKESTDPWVNVINVHLDENDPTKGYFELDWNDAFIGLLGEAGYAGSTQEEIVSLWFNDLCRSIVLEQELGLTQNKN